MRHAPSRVGIVTPPAPMSKPRGSARLPTILIIAVLAFALFLIAALILFREPMNRMADVRHQELGLRLKEAEEQTLLLRQQAEARARENAVASRLTDATHAFDQLRSTNDRLSAQLQIILGVPLESAIAAPPTQLRKAIIVSDAALRDWTNLINSRLTPEQAANSERLLSTVRSNLALQAVTPSDERELDLLVEWTRKKTEAIDAINLDFLRQNQPLDEPAQTPTISAPERRSVE